LMPYTINSSFRMDNVITMIFWGIIELDARRRNLKMEIPLASICKTFFARTLSVRHVCKMVWSVLNCTLPTCATICTSQRRQGTASSMTWRSSLWAVVLKMSLVLVLPLRVTAPPTENI
jgi:hypothetical protein